ncbi:PilZ domain-containing protein [Thermodesulfobacteriota bacterium]
MQQKRKYHRFPIELNAKVFGCCAFLHRNCRITEISREGLLLTARIDTTCKHGPVLLLEIDVPSLSSPICVMAHMQWTQRKSSTRKARCVVGARITLINPEEQEILMQHAYSKMINRAKLSHDAGLVPVFHFDPQPDTITDVSAFS